MSFDKFAVGDTSGLRKNEGAVLSADSSFFLSCSRSRFRIRKRS